MIYGALGDTICVIFSILAYVGVMSERDIDLWRDLWVEGQNLLGYNLDHYVEFLMQFQSGRLKTPINDCRRPLFHSMSVPMHI